MREEQLTDMSASRLRALQPLQLRAISPEPLKPATRFVLALPVSVDGLQGQLATHPWHAVPAQPPQPPRPRQVARLRVPRPRSVWNILRNTGAEPGRTR